MFIFKGLPCNTVWAPLGSGLGLFSCPGSGSAGDSLATPKRRQFAFHRLFSIHLFARTVPHCWHAGFRDHELLWRSHSAKLSYCLKNLLHPVFPCHLSHFQVEVCSPNGGGRCPSGTGPELGLAAFSSVLICPQRKQLVQSFWHSRAPTPGADQDVVG